MGKKITFVAEHTIGVFALACSSLFYTGAIRGVGDMIDRTFDYPAFQGDAFSGTAMKYNILDLVNDQAPSVPMIFASDHRRFDGFGDESIPVLLAGSAIGSLIMARTRRKIDTGTTVNVKE